MARVIGLGGVFVRAKDPKALAEWYRSHLGFEIDFAWNGACFPKSHPEDRPGAYNVWSAFPPDTDYFGDAGNGFMVNLVCDDIEALLEQLKASGQETCDAVIPNDYGKFAWVTDPEGRRVELWGPPDELPPELREDGSGD